MASVKFGDFSEIVGKVLAQESVRSNFFLRFDIINKLNKRF